MKRLLEDAPISVKVSLAPVFAILCLLIVAAVGWLSNRSLVQDVKVIGRQGIERLVNAQAFSSQLTEIHQMMYQTLSWEAIGQRPPLIKQLDTQILHQLEGFQRAVDNAAQDIELSPTQHDAMTGLGKEFKIYTKYAKDILDLKSAGISTAASLVPTLDNEYKSNAAHMVAFVKNELEAARSTVESSEASATRNLTLMGLAVMAALALSSGLVFYLSGIITSPLTQAAHVASALAQGDLTQQKHMPPAESSGSLDATGRVIAALRDMSFNLNKVVSDIRVSAEEIRTASSEIASGNADLSSRTENAAASLQRTASSVGQLNASIKTSSENSVQVNSLAQQAAQVAREGGEAVSDVVHTMDGISTQARKIGEIVAVIDGIAFQTNILALNAAVEAARAGEQGRGFAVVAQEVRTLAGRSATASREIRELISHSIEQVESGSAKVQVAGTKMGRIVESIQQVSGMVKTISQATIEQAATIAEVNHVIIEMDQATQQNAAMVEQAAAATDSLSTQAQGLVDMLQKFRTV